jgi:hypothetical protein
MKFLIATVLACCVLAGCDNEASVASRNLSTEADNFGIMRRIVFINGITDKYLLSIEGLCSQEPKDGRLAVTCKTGPSSYKKHFLGLSHNVTYMSEQLEPAKVSVYHYKVIFRPSTIIPDIDLAK